MEEIIKQFFDWTKRKIFHHLNEVSEKPVFYREKEIWWAALGQNIGYEVNGKNESYERPVLILKRYNEAFFLYYHLLPRLKIRYRGIRFL